MKKYTKESWVGVFVLIGLLCVGYLTIKLGKMEVIGGNDYVVKAKFTSVAGLKAGAQVEVAGVPVGKVSEIELDPKTFAALVSMRIGKDVELSEDTIASIKTSGLIGDKYVKLTPGGAQEMLGNNGMIVDTESAVDIEELISKYVFGNVS
ncbi:outer membrane lipid asymmetry maintenance protein MlaD [Oceanidesulfovibrio marinus]|uniref:Outer membrane lipid asymmetry maintenance protein MlaD n=1 Tax=Oceanidesulfovibrio marinus TaxID=370038 RepID=A0A6P1ZKG5_9BACT|nr:outer membrane lipid asymmetry maintenance protein MlaD [Oceanidesulfovibrio marinus]QJT07523.1 outer membrane lipid asymmetry maintenance protein MlaD [Oceanidesulfovibrio marinus]TVM34563.1 outer membrane lipid asymmetry maintenance protein MlaD [Oceanidesulfovibrio marinus]